MSANNVKKLKEVFRVKIESLLSLHYQFPSVPQQ